MFAVRAFSVGCLVALLSAGVYAQQTQQPAGMTPGQTDSHGGGTTPGGLGSPGGTQVGTSNAHTTGAGAGAVADSSPADQPLMATGQDLNGPPVRFAPDDTPE